MIRHYSCTVFLVLLSTFSFAQSLDVTPNEAFQGETLEVTITGQDVDFKPASQTSIIFTQGTTTNANTEVLSNLENVGRTSLSDTLVIGSDFNTGPYDVIFEKGGEEVVEQDSLFTVKVPSGQPSYTYGGNNLNAKIYPNPLVRENFKLKVDVPRAMRLRARIFSTSGKVVKQVFDQQVTAGNQEFQNLSLGPDLPSGVYLLQLKAQDNQFSEVIRIQKQ